MSAPEPSRFASETTDQGEQTLVPGVAPITLAGRLAWRAAQPLGGGRALRPCDHGLFDTSARAQLELFDAPPCAAADHHPDELPPLEPGGG